jgi:hypothetical protein
MCKRPDFTAVDLQQGAMTDDHESLFASANAVIVSYRDISTHLFR